MMQQSSGAGRVGFVILSLIMVSSCSSWRSDKTLLRKLSVSEVLFDPVALNRQYLCVTGIWKYDYDFGILSLRQKSSETAVPPYPAVLSVKKFAGNIVLGQTSTVCGRIQLDKRCFEKPPAPPEGEFICAPRLVELHAQ
jgi:hypothetical protein